MRKRQGSFSAILVAVIVLILLAGTAYLGAAAVAERRTRHGEKLLLDGQFAGAADKLKEAEKYNKFTMRKNARVTELLAESYYGLAEYDSALEYYKRVIKSEPGNAHARYRLGLIYIDRKEYKEADAQVAGLEKIRTYEAQQYAAELSEAMREDAIKDVFKDVYDKLAPRLPKIPGLTDIFKESPPAGSDGRDGIDGSDGKPEQENISPDVSESLEDLMPSGRGTRI